MYCESITLSSQSCINYDIISSYHQSRIILEFVMSEYLTGTILTIMDTLVSCSHSAVLNHVM